MLLDNKTSGLVGNALKKNGFADSKQSVLSSLFTLYGFAVLQPEIMRVVFKDAGFADDVVKTNAVQILKQAGIEDVRSL